MLERINVNFMIFPVTYIRYDTKVTHEEAVNKCSEAGESHALLSQRSAPYVYMLERIKMTFYDFSSNLHQI